ncbi:G-type lectin S-receptor-like serine/threonine-protein kinase At4g03230 isoform X2 [Lycium ferocissimum]|uniref:G-type lectin S-receptor-like serine/threonine-protein kinase At4g03230 isoform X2 n=1 Tax=Lycium ferocissimum TaxID=112874 RepID=UPI0028167229|nr:G-type lectin S-receptor-like serine/threonine-protein kinase At4g03230 isoform X2 [Lycium ferocissimum]
MQSTSVFLFPFLLYLCHLKCHSRDIITSDNLLRNEGETLVSAGKIFELGFFNTTSDDGEFRTYVGIWYRASPETVVWVANRDNSIPISAELLVVAFHDDGNLKVLDSTGNSYFSTDLASAPSSKRTAKLFDSGNLVLIDDLSGKRLWQSFNYTTDTFLPGMKMDDELKLTAWGVTQKDPSTGNYTFQLNPGGNSEYAILQRTVLRWKGSAPAASANPFSFWELPPFVVSMLSNSSKESDSSPQSTPNTSHVPFFNKTRTDNIASVSYTRLVMNSSGEIQLYGWDDKSRGWFEMWSEPQGPCGVYNTCGKFGICNSEIMPLCKCLPGFDPASPDDWMAGKYTGGCSRKSDSNCNKKSEFDTFLNMHAMKFEEPDLLYSEAKSEEDCRKECLGNCNCLAYSYFEVAKPRRGISSTETVSRCSIWTSDLNNLQEDYTGGFNLSVRVAITDIGAIRRRNCKPCGPIIIPYPLSSQPDCGDPLYYSFSCDDLTGEASFQTLNGSYPVIDISKENRTFVIEVHVENVTDSCDTKTKAVWLNRSLHFHPINQCYDGKLQNLSSGGVINEIQIMWEPPSEPTCTTSADCEDWPNSSCGNITGQGQKRCLCNQHFKWDGLALNCTKASSISFGSEQGAWSGKKAASLNLKALIISISLTAGIITMCCISYVIYRNKKVARRKAEEIIVGNRIDYLPESESSSKYVITEDDKKRIDVPFFNLKSILVATDNFSDANRLGQGGFGPVYKGMFPQGQEMAVKRLSSHSSQGAEEFKNEVMLIAKLQHRNLVRLLGYCIEANEKILLYEYMPNKSLDTFIFGHALRQLLDWNIRFDIILGIARGLHYLHHDSRLRIIHRDLKTSNILLDEEMNAKISDFGLARIVEGKSIEANTQKIAGTFGYLSPEYALEGLFSIKSDVFAFGVVVLEIISGKRNLELFEGTNLLGQAWKLWMENRALEVMDPILVEKFNETEALKCINVALLCVQEDSGDRPTMSNVIVMLGSENMALPRPNQPAFVTRRNTTSSTSSSSYFKPDTGSNNELTITVEQGR